MTTIMAEQDAGDPMKLLSRVSYQLAKRITTQVATQLGAIADTKASSMTPDVKYTFEIPNGEAKNNGTLISLFLYDVHEDQLMRHSAMPAARARYPMSAGKRPIRLCYLITCWFGKTNPEKPDAKAEQYAMRVTDALLSALMSLRGTPLIADAYCRILPPSEKLFSLGQFWQALEDPRPRLTFGLTITVPYAPAGSESPPKPVRVVDSVQVKLDPPAHGDLSDLHDATMPTVKLIADVMRARQAGDTDIRRSVAANALLAVLSKEASRWQADDGTPSLLSMTAIPSGASASLGDAVRAKASVAVAWSRRDAEDAPAFDRSLLSALKRSGRVSGVTVAEAVTVLGDVGQSSATAHGDTGSAPASGGTTSTSQTMLSIADVMGLSGAFGCFALAHRLDVLANLDKAATEASEGNGQ